MGLLLFLSSGLFLGWSLGANDAANVFGTAVGTRMVRFRTAAVICAVFIVLGATLSGAGAAHTLGRLGAVNTLAGAFTVALAAALTTFWMTRLKMPVSTSQAIVGAIIGWNIYAASVTDTDSLTRIVLTWVACPLISGTLAVVLFMLIRWLINTTNPHLLRLDAMTRAGLILAGAFGSYSLGANNIANVMGVFVPENPFGDLSVFGLFVLSGTQQLFLLGSVAIGVGVFTYSERVMRTVGGGLVRLSPVPALVVVLAHSITLFLFASEGLEHFLASHHLPTFPLVPVSSSQAVVGAIVGISLFKGAPIRYRVLGEISVGWITTPIIAGVVAFLMLFFVDNVFDQRVHQDMRYRIDRIVVEELARQGVADAGLDEIAGTTFANGVKFKRDLETATTLAEDDIHRVIELSRLGHWMIDPGILAEKIDTRWLTAAQLDALRTLADRRYERSWLMHRELAATSPDWSERPPAAIHRSWNKELAAKLVFLDRVFRLERRDEP
ncbi:MAG: inorganic phosphate transporter [bacterium]|nr:inorganic phosphate transporter [bacterium]